VNVARNSQDAKRRWRPRYEAYHTWMKQLLHAVNPDPPPYLNKPFDYEWLLQKGPAIAGSPAEIAERLHALGEMLGVETHLLYMDMGGLPQRELLEMIELIGSDVLPLLGDPASPAARVRAA
jgi:alkanesulfonate monooxygenase SsuD/methylene tetrahydromethanopterin reductase-like flavin-dependent oxidoreductase (luciferase family)